jgi:hypothetical protein
MVKYQLTRKYKFIWILRTYTRKNYQMNNKKIIKIRDGLKYHIKKLKSNTTTED